MYKCTVNRNIFSLVHTRFPKIERGSMYNHEGIIRERYRGVNLRYTGGGDPLCTFHRGEGLYSVQLGSLQGVYERFPIKN